jgi:cytochrome c oxidase subunit 1
MFLFSIANHATGLMGMPRRVYDASYGGSPIAAEWSGLTLVSAIGGIMLFVSAAFFLLVMLGTVLAGRRAAQTDLEFAEPLQGAPERRGIWDRFGLWIGVAIVLVVIAYAYPLVQHLQLERFGSPGFKPF